MVKEGTVSKSRRHNLGGLFHLPTTAAKVLTRRQACSSNCQPLEYDMMCMCTCTFRQIVSHEPAIEPNQAKPGDHSGKNHLPSVFWGRRRTRRNRWERGQGKKSFLLLALRPCSCPSSESNFPSPRQPFPLFSILRDRCQPSRETQCGGFTRRSPSYTRLQTSTRSTHIVSER